MKYTVEIDLRKRVVFVVDAQDEQEAQDIVIAMVDSGDVYQSEEFLNCFDTDYEILSTSEEE